MTRWRPSAGGCRGWPSRRRTRSTGPSGPASLVDLFEGRCQLIVYRAFFEPGVYGWPDHACRGCSMVADQVAHVAHLNARDVTLAFASRAPQADIERLKERMGWEMPWYTMVDGFDADFGVDEWHGTNVFIRDGDRVFRTYFVNNRGDEAMGSTWSYLDITAARTPGGVGGLARGLPPDAAVHLVELARRIRRGPVGPGVALAGRAWRSSVHRRGRWRRQMIVIGHVGGVPVEEMLPQLSAVGHRLALAATWVVSYVRRPRARATDRQACDGGDGSRWRQRQRVPE